MGRDEGSQQASDIVGLPWGRPGCCVGQAVRVLLDPKAEQKADRSLCPIPTAGGDLDKRKNKEDKQCRVLWKAQY